MFGPGVSLFERERIYRRRLRTSGLVATLLLLTLSLTVRQSQPYFPPRAGYPGPMQLLPELDIVRDIISEKRTDAGGHPLEEAIEAVDMELTAKAEDFPEEKDGADQVDVDTREDAPRPGQGVGEQRAARDASIIPITSDQIVLLRFVKASYPLEARLMGIEGRFLVQALVGKDGTVLEAQVADAGVHRSLGTAAREAVLRWRFAPVKRSGTPVQFWVEIPFQFTLEESAGT